MEIKITVTVGPDTAYRATFHPAPEKDEHRAPDARAEVAASPVRPGTSQVAPGLAIALPAAEASLPS